MTNEGWASEGLGHQVGWVVCRGYILQMYVVMLDCIADEVELDANVASPEGCMGGGGNRHAGLIVFANEGWAIRGMTKLRQKHAQENCLCCCESKRNIFGFNNALGNC